MRFKIEVLENSLGGLCASHPETNMLMLCIAILETSRFFPLFIDKNHTHTKTVEFTYYNSHILYVLEVIALEKFS